MVYQLKTPLALPSACYEFLCYVDSDDSGSTIPLTSLFGVDSDVEREEPAVEAPPTTLYLLRMSALRNHDNKAFASAISDKSRRFRAAFFFDPWYTCVEGKNKIGLNRSVLLGPRCAEVYILYFLS
jgi:hypothetical protein